MHKIVFTAPFYRACGAQMLCLLSCYSAGKLAVAPMQPTSSHMISHHPSASFPKPKNKEEVEKHI
jgi:hypothetical protein